MPDYTIETTYHLPVFRHRTYSAETCDAACRAAIEDNDWDDARHDYETAGETHVTGIWQGADAAYRAPAIDQAPCLYQYRSMQSDKGNRGRQQSAARVIGRYSPGKWCWTLSL